MTRKDEPSEQRSDEPAPDEQHGHEHRHHRHDHEHGHTFEPEPLEADLEDVVELFAPKENEKAGREIDYGAPPPG